MRQLASGLDDSRRALGRFAFYVSCSAAAAGGLSIVACLAVRREGPVIASLAAAWLFLAALSAGGVALAAAIDVCGGRWAERVSPLACSTSRFFLPAFAVLVVIVSSAGRWMPAEAAPHGTRLIGLLARELGSAAILFHVGRRYVLLATARRTEGPARRGWAVVYLITYAAVLSLWAADLIIAVSSGAPSTVVPAFYLVGGFLSAIAWVSIAANRDRGRLDDATRHDLGKLVFGLATFWGYLLWSAFLPVWYGNLPDETGQLLARWNGMWKALSTVVVTTVFIFPFLFFFPERTKRDRRLLLGGSAVVLAGLFGNCILLVLPSVTMEGGAAVWLASAVAMAGLCGVFALSVGDGLDREPPESRTVMSLVPARAETEEVGA
ncbi:MAG: hypothetical protein LAO51_12120 [Acidobacteriia bacterium]|nr:hypothetical protein [Terriglobia bacterium]